MVYQLKQSYFWAEGYAPKFNANIVGSVVEQIVERDGAVTRESFLEESRPTTSPTHDLFEWNDAKAAEAYRLEQARLTISQLRISYKDASGESKTVKAYVNTEAKRGNAVYVSIEDALSDAEKRKILFYKMSKELNLFIDRNKCIEGLADLLIERGKELKKE